MPDPAQPSREAIEAAQLEQLRSLLAEILPGNRFYSNKFNATGITFDLASLADFSNRFPFTTKSEVAEDQKNHPPFGTNLTYPIGRYTRFHQTSGTSGAPLRWLDTPESWDAMVDCWASVLRHAGARPGDRIYFAFSFGPFLGFWLAFEAAARLECFCAPGGGLSSTARAQAILDLGITILCCTPTYATRLAEAAAEVQIDLRSSQVRTLVVAGEPGGSLPAVRARISELWHGARVFDHHGMTEVGPVSYECPAHAGRLHILESAFLPEVIDPATSKTVPAGQSGELVLTTLARIGSPLLRYRTGDLVKTCGSKSACSCGSNELALDGGIIGRTDDMVVVRGVNVYPAAIEEIVRGFSDVAEFQVEISSDRALTELILRVEPVKACTETAALAKKLEMAFENNLTLRVPVAIVPAGSLPRFEMKAKRWQRR